jgi:hypothetical protein
MLAFLQAWLFHSVRPLNQLFEMVQLSKNNLIQNFFEIKQPWRELLETKIVV